MFVTVSMAMPVFVAVFLASAVSVSLSVSVVMFMPYVILDLGRSLLIPPLGDNNQGSVLELSNGEVGVNKVFY